MERQSKYLNIAAFGMEVWHIGILFFVKIPQATFRSLKTINDCLEKKKDLNLCIL